MVGEPLLKIMFGPEKGLLGVEKKIKRETTLVEDPYPGGNCLARRGLDPHSPFRTYTKFFLFSERESGNRTEGDRVRKSFISMRFFDNDKL